MALLAALCCSPAVLDRFVLPAARTYLPGASAPPSGVEAARSPLGAPPAVDPSDGYRFHESPDPGQEMVAYDPCRPVHYVVRPDHAPPGGPELVEEAVAEVAAATGLRFVHDGPTGEGPSERREAYQPDAYGRRWAPVLITWSDPGEAPGLAGDVVGLGGSSSSRARGGPVVYVTGQVTLDAPALRRMLRYPEGPARVRAVIVHELAHVVGLDHVENPAQLMHADDVGAAGLADGDRAGLARLGAGECVPQL